MDLGLTSRAEQATAFAQRHRPKSSSSGGRSWKISRYSKIPLASSTRVLPPPAVEQLTCILPQTRRGGLTRLQQHTRPGCDLLLPAARRRPPEPEPTYDQRPESLSFLRPSSSPPASEYRWRMAEGGITRDWHQHSPFATTPAAQLTDLRRDGSVRFLLVSGERDDGAWGVVGAFWLSDEGDHGGFLVSPESLWHGSEMVRSFRGALLRGWTEERIYQYWEAQAGSTSIYMIDPEESASSIFQVARRVGTI